MSFMDSRHQPQKTVKNIAHRRPLRTDLPQFKNNLNKDAKKSEKNELHNYWAQKLQTFSP